MPNFLSNIGHALKKGVVGAGHFAGDVLTNPWVKGLGAGALALTGAGIPLSAAIMGGSGALGELIQPGGNLGKAASGGVKGAAIGTAAGLAGKALGGLTHGAIGSGGDAAGAAGAAGGTNWGKLAGEAVTGIPAALGAVKSIPGVSSITDFLTGNGGANALGVAQAANAMNLQKQSSDWANKAIGGLEGNYADRARLRAAGIEGMLNPITPDLSSLLKNSGPYVQGLPKIAPTAQYTGIGNATQPGRMS